jgi:hypothetical protein
MSPVSVALRRRLLRRRHLAADRSVGVDLAAPLTLTIDCFNEYSDEVAACIGIGAPEALVQLEQIPTLLVCEVGAREPARLGSCNL